MNALTSARLVKPSLKKMLALALGAIFALTGMGAFAQSSTVTSLTDARHGKPGYRNGNTFSSAQFNFPTAIALDSSGTLMFVADYNNNAIRMVNSLGNKSSSISFSVYTNKNGINHPIGVAVDANTNVYVLNYANRTNGSLMIFNGAYPASYNFYVSILATNATHLMNPAALALDYLGNVYITVQSNTVIKVAPTGTNTVVGVITNAGTNLRGIVCMDNGNLAICDAGNNGIWMMNPTNGSSVKYTGFNGVGDQTGPISIASFNHPEGLAKAGLGYLVVADRFNNKVKVVDASGNVTRLYGVNSIYWKNVKGLSTKGWNDGTVNPIEQYDTVQARQPYGLALDASGNVYDTEVYYHLLRTATGTGLPPLPTPPPSSPTILSITTNIGQITLTWTAVGSATSYNVKRRDNTNSAYTTIANVTTTSYTDSNNIVGGNTYYYVVSAVNGTAESANSSAVSVIAPLGPVGNPQIGYLTVVNGTNYFTPDELDTFYNDPIIIIVAQKNSEALYVVNDSSTNTTIPDGSSPSIPSGFIDGGNQNYLTYQILPDKFLPDSTIVAIGTNTTPYYYNNTNNFAQNSALVSARYRFVTLAPTIPRITNSAEFTLSEGTTNSGIIYTFDGSDPATNGSAFIQGPNPTNSWEIQTPFTITSNTTFTVRAFKQYYQTSSIVTATLSVADFHPNTICFGLGYGPGSSQFVASPGQSFVVPVGLELLADAPSIYGLQFNLTVTNLGNNPVAPGDVAFDSLVGKPDAANDGYYEPIPTYEYIGKSPTQNDPNAFLYNGEWYQDLQFNNTNNNNLLSVGWLEVYGRTNLYNTLAQNLLTYPLINGTEPYPTKTQIVIGGYSFGIPTNAAAGDIYQIQIGRPSATTYPPSVGVGYGIPVSLFAPADTNASAVGPGTINALKNVTIGQKKYLVGSVYPANWFNAGDFGGTNIQNIDVIRVFDFAAYPIASPPSKSDLYDTMDSCGNLGVWDSSNNYFTNSSIYPLTTNLVNAVTNFTTVTDTNGVSVTSIGSISDYSTVIYITTYEALVPFSVTNIQLATPPASPTTNVSQASYAFPITTPVNALFDGNDTSINQIGFGDGLLDVCDVYVTFRRSLDSTLLWYERFWTNGQRAADTNVVNAFPSSPSGHIALKNVSANIVQPKALGSVPPFVNFTAGNVQIAAGRIVKVPIKATIQGGYPLRLLMLNLTVAPVTNAPELTTQVQFTQSATALGSPYTTYSDGYGNYSAAWLNQSGNGATGGGITGTNVVIGNLSVTIPSSAPSGAIYGIYFDHASASPNGLASFPNKTVTGSITVK